MLKKFLTSVFVVLLLTTFVLGGVYANSSNVINEDPIFSKQKEGIENYKKLIDHFKDELPSQYGGAFLDEEGTLNINLVEEGKDIKDLLKDNKIKYHKAKFSLDYLNETLDLLDDQMAELGISLAKVDEQNNMITVYVNSLKEANIEKIKQISPAIHIEEGEVNIVFTGTTEVINGNQIVIGSDAVTLGSGAYKNSTGKYGFLTVGHAGIIGDSVTYGGSTIGTYKQHRYGGNIDAGWIERKEPYWFWETYWKLTNKYPNGDTWSSYSYASNLPLGAALAKHGATTNKTTGTLLSKNASYSINGINFSGMFEANYLAWQGDSGATVRNGSSIVGIQSAVNVNSGYAYFGDIQHAINEFNAVPYYE